MEHLKNLIKRNMELIKKQYNNARERKNVSGKILAKKFAGNLKIRMNFGSF